MFMADIIIQRLLKIFADNQDKRHQIIHWGVFFGVTLLTFILINFLPEPVEYYVDTKQPCANPIIVDAANGKVSCSPFEIYNHPVRGLLVQGVSPLNQFVLLQSYFKVRNPKADIDIKATVTVSVYSVRKQQDGFYAVKLSDENATYQIVNGKTSKYFTEGGSFEGYTVDLAYIRQIAESGYLFVVTYPNDLDTTSNLENIMLEACTINKAFSVFSIVTRYVFFGGSVVGLILYTLNLKRFKLNDLVVEQKLGWVLGLLLIFFNDPFYIVTITSPNGASSFFSVLFVVNLVCFLLFFWLCVLKRIQLENGQKESHVVQWKKCLVVSLAWVFLLGYYLYFSYRHNSDPFVEVQELTSGGFYIMMICSTLLLVGILGYIVISFIMIYRQYEQKIWRNRLFTNFSVFFVFCMFLFFFSSGFDIYSVFPNRVLIIYVQVNLYVIYILFMYSPTKEAKAENLGLLGSQEIPMDTQPRALIEFPNLYDEFDEQEEPEFIERKKQEVSSEDSGTVNYQKQLDHLQIDIKKQDHPEPQKEQPNQVPLISAPHKQEQNEFAEVSENFEIQ